jgi:hypothetical protein
LLADLVAWCTEDLRFTIGLIAGEGGSGKSRLAAELCDRMHTSGWETGFVSRTKTLTELAPVSSTLLIIDYPENWLTVLGAAPERLTSRAAGPPVRVLLLAREPAAVRRLRHFPTHLHHSAGKGLS